MNSDTFIRKLHRAHEALSQSDGSATSSVKTLSASFGTKWPYKRTMSAPASIISRQENKGIHINQRFSFYGMPLFVSLTRHGKRNQQKKNELRES